MSTRLMRKKTLTSNPERTIESNPGRCGPHLCQDVGARKSNRTRTSGRKHLGPRTWKPYTQLLDWERNNRTNEIAAVAAAEKLRSRVGYARDKDEGSKMSAAKAAEELGGYCEGRLQVWTDGSCLDPRWEAIARAGARVFFLKDSKLNIHFSIKARTGQTSVRGQLEEAKCATQASDVPPRIHTDCEWVEKGIKEILNAIAKGETTSKREHPKVWALIEERAKPLPAGWLEVEHVPGHATEEMVMQGELWRNTESPTNKWISLQNKEQPAGDRHKH